MRLDQKEEIKRLVIYFFYDKDGVVDRYVPYMLEDILKNCSELFVVVNGKLTPEGRKIFTSLTPNLLVRENKGFDVWAYKTAMESYGWDKLAEFDEVVLMNFTLYGPLYPLSEMFSEMNSRDLDFWGITKHHGFPFDPFGTIPDGFIPEHIQSSFICIRKNMLSSPEFHKYWDNMPEVKSYGDAVGKHEAIFTYTFNNYGFVSDVYVHTDDLKEVTHYPLMLKARELIENRRCPVFKRKSFTNEYYEFLNACVGEPTVELYEYIRDNLDYDLNLVWDNLLRVENMADIKKRMHLNYVFPRDVIMYPEVAPYKKIALIMHIYFADQIDYCLHYAKSMPKNSDIYITACSDDNIIEIKNKFSALPNKLKVIKVENRGRDVSALLVAGAEYVAQYDLVCFAHDKKTTQLKPLSVGESFAYKCFENILGSKEYVRNVISKFQTEPRLGLLMPPPPNHGGFYGIFGTEWGSNFDNTVQLAEKLGIDVNIDISKEPISPLGTMFWFRPQALKPLFEKKWKYEDFPQEPNQYDGTLLHAIERIYGFVAQACGYYAAWCMSDKFSAMELTNYNFMIREYSMTIYKIIGHQYGFNIANAELQKVIPSNRVKKLRLKNQIRAIVPKPIWKICKRIYRLFGGKKWLDSTLC